MVDRVGGTGPWETERTDHRLMYELHVHSTDMIRHMAGEVASVSVGWSHGRVVLYENTSASSEQDDE